MCKIYYCPRCGRMFDSSHVEIYNFTRCYECHSNFSFFSTELLKAEKSDLNWHQFPLFTDIDGVFKFIPRTQNSFTLDMYKAIWNKYVDIPSNKKLNTERFEQFKKEITEFLESGGFYREKDESLGFAINKARQLEKMKENKENNSGEIQIITCNSYCSSYSDNMQDHDDLDDEQYSKDEYEYDFDRDNFEYDRGIFDFDRDGREDW